MSGLPPSQETPLSSKPLAFEDLVNLFHQAAKPRSEFRIGIEHEKFAVLQKEDGSVVPLPYHQAENSASVEGLLYSLIPFGWQPIKEAGNLVALRRGKTSVTLEPGGQVEFSGSPHVSSAQAIQELQTHLDEIKPYADAHRIVFLNTGFQPFHNLEKIPHLPTARYNIMRPYLQKTGSRGLDMMYRTATAQANLDYSNEADAMAKLKTAICLYPLVSSVFAASPLVDGQPCNHQTYREGCWLYTDDDRCGILPFLFTKEASFAEYVNWALDVPMFFVYRNQTYVPAPFRELTFRKFMKEGFQGHTANLNDWEIHLSTLFPEARLRRYIEVRSADAGPLPLVKALSSLWQGIFYCDDAHRAAWDLVRLWSYDLREHLRYSIPPYGIHHPPFSPYSMAYLCRELVHIANQGLQQLGAHEEQKLLEPALQVVEERRTWSDQIVRFHAEVKGDKTALLKKLSLL